MEGLTGAGKPLAGIKDAIANVSVTDPSVTGKVPYLLNIKEVQDLSMTKRKENDWWLRSPGRPSRDAAFVNGDGDVRDFGGNVDQQFGVRPALKLNLSSVIFSSDTKTFSLKPYSVTLTGGANAATSGGATSQTGVTMTTVTYMANSGYIFPETSDLYKTTNGITVARTSDTVVTVSGKPTADVTITIPNAEAKFTVVKGTPINLPQTGDGSNVFIHVLVGLLALSGLGLVIKKR